MWRLESTWTTLGVNHGNIHVKKIAKNCQDIADMMIGYIKSWLCFFLLGFASLQNIRYQLVHAEFMNNSQHLDLLPQHLYLLPSAPGSVADTYCVTATDRSVVLGTLYGPQVDQLATTSPRCDGNGLRSSKN